MAEKEKILATFRIDREAWEAFKKEAFRDGSNASAVLIELVRGYSSGKKTTTTTAPDSGHSRLDSIEQRLDSIDEVLDQRIDEVRSQLQDQLDSLRGKLKARLVR